MKKEITITDRHIEQATTLCNESHNREACCPVALALREQGFPQALVLDGCLQLQGSIRKSKGTPIPAAVDKFVRAFDTVGRKVSPFTFELVT